MRDYGKVQSSFWQDGRVRRLDDEGKILALYLLTGPHSNQLGCFRLPDGYAAEDLNWDPITLSERFRELSEIGFATRDEGSKWVLIFDFLRFNKVENPNQGKAAAKLFEQIGDDNPLKGVLAKEIRKHVPTFPTDALDRFETLSEGLREPFLNQSITEQEHKQGQEQEQIGSPRQRAERALAVVEQPTKPKASRKSKLPDGFPGPDALTFAEQTWRTRGVFHLDPAAEAQKFRDHHLANGVTMADWPARWRTWVSNAPNFTRAARQQAASFGGHGSALDSSLAMIASGAYANPGDDE